jgi:hypothetical protein
VSFPVGQLSAPVLTAAFGAADTLTGGGVAAVAMPGASLVPLFRRIEADHRDA